jgi:DNA polymerase IV
VNTDEPASRQRDAATDAGQPGVGLTETWQAETWQAETWQAETRQAETRQAEGGEAEASPDHSRRCIFHVDMDAFFAAVEIKEQPSLVGLPVVVGGSGNRGVVASASYAARAFGVRSAMPAVRARRLCPGLVILAPRFDLYHAYSERLHSVLRTFTPLVEGLGLDEAFLDFSHAGSLFGPPQRGTAQLRQRVRDDVGLSCSVGSGPNKLVAKLASKAAKPRATKRGPLAGPGTVVVGEHEVLDFLWPMPVEALWGVGPASAGRLHKLGVSTVGQLAALPAQAVVVALGKSAGQLVHSLAWGQDPRPVVPERPVKSIGQEETYPVDVVDRGHLERRLVAMADSVAARVRRDGSVARTVTLKLRYGDFTTLTRSHTLDRPQASGPVLAIVAKSLLAALDLRNGVRLLGLSASGLQPVESSPGEQLQLELGRSTAGGRAAAPAPTVTDRRSEAGQPGWARASEAVDAVRARFGADAVAPAATVGGPGPRGEEREDAPSVPGSLRDGND